MNLQHVAVLRALLEEITILTHVNAVRSNNLLTLSIDRRICNLCEELLEIVEKWLILIRECRDWSINSHRAYLLSTIQGHVQDSFMVVLIRIAKCLLQLLSFITFNYWNFLIWNLDIL